MHSRATTTVVTNALEKFRQRRTPEVREVQARGAEVIEKVEIDLCPVSSVEHVHLYETIKREQIDENTRQVTAGDDDHAYVDQVENGGEFTEAQPFVEPARQEGRRWMNAEYKRH